MFLSVSSATELPEFIGKTEHNVNEEVSNVLEDVNLYIRWSQLATFVSYRQNDIKQHMCGGVIIGDWYSLTIGPCGKKIQECDNVYAQFGQFQHYVRGRVNVESTIQITDGSPIWIVKVSNST